jgi:hypothetical protein
MVTLASVEAQLKSVGCNFRLWGRSEVRELCQILLPGEKIAQAVNGQYEAGFAMLVATDFRVLLVDKKPKYLTLKDIRFDMITELDFANRLMDSTIRIYTPNRELRFTAFNTVRLRKLFTHTQHKVMEIRHHFMMQQMQQQQIDHNTPPGLAMTLQRYGGSLETGEMPASLPAPNANYYQQPQLEHPAHQALPQHAQTQHAHQQQHGHDLTTDEQRKLAAMMGAAGLSAIVHNGRVIRDYMTVPFTQRWRKRPYGYTRSPLGNQPASY